MKTLTICLLLCVTVALSACGGSTPTSQGGDDTAAVQAAVDRGGVVTFEARTYHLTKTIIFRNSNTIIQGAGPQTIFEFKATANRIQCTTDRVFTTPCEADYAPPRRVAQPIAIGDMSFVATDDASDLVPGEWVLINDYDNVYGDRAAVDWMQVASVAGNVVYVTQPFRMAFTIARTWIPGKSGLGFEPVLPLVQNLQFRNFAISVPDTGDPKASAGGLSLFMALHVIVDHVQVNDYNAQALYTYLSKDVTFTNCEGIVHNTLNEFASSVDVTIEGNTFSAVNGAAMGLDLGLGFFKVSHNTITQSKNAGAYLLYSVHDGTFDHNNIALVDSSTDISAIGIMAWGVQNVTISDNTLDGGSGSQSAGISVRSQMGEIEVPVINVTVAGNTFGNWVFDYEPGTTEVVN
jgi:Right handed beta helix region